MPQTCHSESLFATIHGTAHAICDQIETIPDRDRAELLLKIAGSLPYVSKCAVESESLSRADQLRVLEHLAVGAIRSIFELRPSALISHSEWEYRLAAPESGDAIFRGDGLDGDRLLVFLGLYLCSALTVCDEHAGFQRVAQECYVWPVALGSEALANACTLGNASISEVRSALKGLSLGTRAPLCFSERGKAISRSSARNLALCYHVGEIHAYWAANPEERTALTERLTDKLRTWNSRLSAFGNSIADPIEPYWEKWQKLADTLPQLTPSTTEMWFRVLWTKVLVEYDDHPEVELAPSTCMRHQYFCDLPDLSALGRAGGDEAVHKKREDAKARLIAQGNATVPELSAIEAMPFLGERRIGARKAIRKALLRGLRNLVTPGDQGNRPA